MDRKHFLRNLGLTVAGGSFLNSPFLKPDTKNAIKPKKLSEGDKIGLVAPAGIVYGEREFDRMKEILSELGFRVEFGEHIRKRYGYFSGTDEQRAVDLMEMFANPEINGIMSVRGGWGSARILQMLDFDLIRNNPKIFCGFSDITALHLSIYRQTGLITFHGPNGNSDWTPFTRRHFKNVLTTSAPGPLEHPGKELHRIQTISPGSTKGKLLGGNLTILTSILGSGYLPDFDGAILFLEDIGEDVYRVDRMLTQLRMNGILEQISGFIFGKCTDCKEGSPATLTLSQVFRDHLASLGIPAFYGSMISHEPNIFTLPVGIEAEMNSVTGRIRLLESAVTD